MQVDFRQGIVKYPYTGLVQQFLSRVGNYMTLNCSNGPTDITFANRTNDYLYTESVTIPNAWGPLVVADQWLYWDINRQTGQRSFGITLLQPLFGTTSTRPTTPQPDQHWFDTTLKQMYVFQSGGWREVIRVFAAKVNASQIIPVGAGLPSMAFAGSQVGITNTISFAGTIVFDELGNPIRRSDGTFFTTENLFFTPGSPVRTIKLEADVTLATAAENIGGYTAVAWNTSGEIEQALYSDVQDTVIGLAPQPLATGQVGNIYIQGKVANPLWNWQSVADIGDALWVSHDIPGLLVTVDPFVTPGPPTVPVQKPPVARILANDQIVFDQGLGGLIQVTPPSMYIVTGSNLDLSGAAVFKQKNGNDFEFRTLKSSTLTITQNASNITLETSAENNTGANIGTGQGVFASKSGTTLQFKTLKSLSAGLAITATIDEIQFQLTGGGGGGSGVQLCELDDVDVGCPPGGNPNGSVLTYNGVTDKWEAVSGLPYDLHFNVVGPAATTADTIVAGIMLSRPVCVPIGAGWCSGSPVGLYYARAYAYTAPASQIDFGIFVRSNQCEGLIPANEVEVQVGTIRFAGGSTTGIFDFTELIKSRCSGDLCLEPGTTITIKPLTTDVAIRDMFVSISGITANVLPTDGCIVV